VRSQGGQFEGNGLANALSRAGDERHLIVERAMQHRLGCSFLQKGLTPANENISSLSLFYPASILHPRNRDGRVRRVGALCNIETVGVGERKTLALGGFHPYNPLTGIMLSRNETTGGV